MDSPRAESEGAIREQCIPFRTARQTLSRANAPFGDVS
jgi:hypothetical protein